MGGGWDCQFLTGNPCHCTKCEGLSISQIMVSLIKFFYDMRGDSLIQKIEDDIDEMGKDIELEDKINQVAGKYQDDVLAKREVIYLLLGWAPERSSVPREWYLRIYYIVLYCKIKVVLLLLRKEKKIKLFLHWEIEE